MECSQCGTKNPDNGKYCDGCGSKLSLCCQKCGSEITPTLKFCENCGEQLVNTNAVKISAGSASSSFPGSRGENLKKNSQSTENNTKAKTRRSPKVADSAKDSGTPKFLSVIIIGVFFLALGYYLAKPTESQTKPVSEVSSSTNSATASTQNVAENKPVQPVVPPKQDDLVGISPISIKEVLAPIPVQQAIPHLDQMLEGVITNDHIKINASVDLIKSISLPPEGDFKAAKISNELGTKLLQSESKQEAVKYFVMALKSDPSDQEIANNLALGLFFLDRMDDAGKAAMAALTINPASATPWMILAMILASQNKHNEAVASYMLGYKYYGNKEKARELLLKQAKIDNVLISSAANNALKQIENE
jgi:hypothetical protein